MCQIDKDFFHKVSVNHVVQLKEKMTDSMSLEDRDLAKMTVLPIGYQMRQMIAVKFAEVETRNDFVAAAVVVAVVQMDEYYLLHLAERNLSHCI